MNPANCLFHCEQQLAPFDFLPIYTIESALRLIIYSYVPGNSHDLSLFLLSLDKALEAFEQFLAADSSRHL
jgi:hypothetical protein